MATLKTSDFTEDDTIKLLTELIDGIKSGTISIDVVAVTKTSNRVDSRDLAKSDQSVITLDVNGNPGSMFELMKGLNDAV